MKYNAYLQSYSHLVFSNRKPFGFLRRTACLKRGRGRGGGRVLLSLVQKLDLKDNTHVLW